MRGRRRNTRLWWAPLLGAAVALGGCRGAFEQHRDALSVIHADGRYGEAAARLDDPEVRALYGEKNEALWLMDRGSLALALGDPDEAVVLLDGAEGVMEDRRSETLGESLGVLLLNDLQAPYLGEPYEAMYLNVFKTLAQLEAGRVQGGATVEARRFAIKADALRDEYLRLAPRTLEEGKLAEGDVRRGLERSGVGSWDSGGQFVESPLGLFLAAVTFQHSGVAEDRESQAVAGRRLQEMIRAQGEILGPVRPEPFEGIGSLPPPPPGMANVLVVAFAGRGPRKEPFTVPPLVIAGVPIYAQVPILRWEPSAASGARFALESGESPELDLVEEFGRIASENHGRQMPLIYARTIARAAAKSAAAAVGAAAVSDDDWARTAVLLGGLAFLMATERADTRAWEFLPGRAFVRLVAVPAGEHSGRVEWLSADGRALYAGPSRTFTAPEQGLVTIVEHFWD